MSRILALMAIAGAVIAITAPEGDEVMQAALFVIANLWACTAIILKRLGN